MQESITTDRLTYPSASGGVRAYLAHPTDGQPWPAIIVIQEVFGLEPHIEDVTRRFARQGYLALAPDLYCHDPVRAALTVQDIEQMLGLARASDFEAAVRELPADRQEPVRRAMEWRNKRDSSTYVPDLLAAVDHLKGRADVRGDAIGAIGYCMGGGLSGQLATAGADIAAAVINYGAVPPLDQVPNVRCVVQGHYGGDDQGITSRVPELEAAMKTHGKQFTAYVYDGAPHAFFNDTRPSYRAEAAKLTWDRTLDFFERHVKRSPVGVR